MRHRGGNNFEILNYTNFNHDLGGAKPDSVAPVATRRITNCHLITGCRG